MATITTRLTIDDFEKLPDDVAKGHELVNGELVDVSGNVGDHNKTRDWAAHLFLSFVSERGLGDVVTEQEYDFDGNAHGPDVSFYGPEKVPLFQGNKRVQPFVPDLAIEIESANDTLRALVRKKDRYRKCGTKEVWLVVMESREVWVFSDHGNQILGEDNELSTPLIPGFQIAVKRLFERIPTRS